MTSSPLPPSFPPPSSMPESRLPKTPLPPQPPSSQPSMPLNTGSALSAPKSIYEMIMSRSTTDPLSSQHYTPQAALHRTVSMSNDQQNTKNGNRTIHKRNNSNSKNNNRDEYALDQLTHKSLPFFVPWHPIAGPQEVPPNYDWLINSCGGKAAIGVFGGGVMGLLMGVFLGAMSDATPPVTIIAGRDVPQAPLREQMKVTMRATAEKSMYWCKNFAFITGVFGGSECLVEKFRGKHDMWNSVASGCITGAALQAKSGPQAAAIGCGGFAAFSIVIDSVMGNY